MQRVLDVGVEAHKPMVGRGALVHQQPHWIALIPERGLHSDEDIAEMELHRLRSDH